MLYLAIFIECLFELVCIPPVLVYWAILIVYNVLESICLFLERK